MTTAHPPTDTAIRPPPAPVGHTPWWVWIVIVAAVGGLTAGVVWRVHSVRAAGENAPAGGGRRGGGNRETPVVVATVRQGDLPVYLYGLGTVTPLKTVTLKSRVDGAITQINYVEGQHVRTGDSLLQVDDRPYRATLDQAKGQLLRDQATVSSAEWNVKQDQQAITSRAISEQQLHNDQATLDGARGALAIDRANIEAAQVNVDYCHIASPIDGVIGLRQVDVGNIVRAGDTTSLAVITQLQPITVLFTLPEDELAQLRRRMATGQPVVVDAYDRTLRQRLARGTLLALDSAIDPATLTIRAKAQFDNGDDALYPSQAVNARLLVDTVKDAVLVPTAAIQHSPTQTFVYVVGPDDAVKVRPVTPGPALTAVAAGESDTQAITDGLAPGETVVTDGVDKLSDGSKVVPRPAEDRRRGATRPATEPTAVPAEPGPTNKTDVGGPRMDRPAAGGRRRQARN